MECPGGASGGGGPFNPRGGERSVTKRSGLSTGADRGARSPSLDNNRDAQGVPTITWAWRGKTSHF